MSLKLKKDVISSILEDVFHRDDNISFYFLKKSIKNKDYETIIPYKTRKKINEDKIKELENKIKIETKLVDLRLIRWSDIVGKLIPASQVFKIPFFDSKNLEIKSHPWRICSVGEHWVSQHSKLLRSGIVTDHDGHCRKNKSRKLEYYSASELRLMSEMYFSQLKSSELPTPNSLDFRYGNKFDLLIGGFVKFWNDVLKPDELLKPNHIKALIAT